MIRNVMMWMIVCAVGACTASPGAHDETQGETTDEIASSSTREVVPTPDVFDAILNTSTPSGCMAATTCPDPKSCGSWSTGFECNETCQSNLCAGGAEGRFGRAFSNQFRDCTLLNGTTCREWALTSILFCGC